MPALNPEEVKVVQETWAEVATDPYELTELGVTFFVRYGYISKGSSLIKHILIAL